MWIASGCYSNWVREVFPEGMHRAKSSTSFRSGVQMNVSKPQELRHTSDWEMLSFEDTLTSLEVMPQPPSVENFTRILRICRNKKNLAYAQRLHAYMRKSGLDAHPSLGNYLVPMLVEVGTMSDAQQVFNRLAERNEYSWTSLITGYIESGELQHALNLYQKMQDDCIHPSSFTLVALLKACSRLKDVERGRQIHAEIARKGLETDPFVGNTLLNMYAKCGSLAKAQEVFDMLPVRDVVSFTALITAYTEHGLGEEALNCFKQMLLEGVSPNALTIVCSLKACSSIGAVDKAQELHAEIGQKGLLEIDPFGGNALVDMYAKCGSLAKAQGVFDKLSVRDAVSWNALTMGYARQGLGEEALNCFEQMQLEGVSPDALTFVCSLKACGSIGATDKGQEIHAEIARKGLLQRDPFVGNALVGMYAKCGLLARAQELFDKLPMRNEVTWNVLITGYVDHGLGDEALSCFQQMQLEGISPNVVAFICSLKACGSIGAMGKGQEIHAEVAINGLEQDIVVGSTLVDMYAKCGSPAQAREAFDKLPVRNEVSWNALIAGYAEHGLSDESLNCFKQMQLEGISPNAVTFVCSLKACGSIGAIDKGRDIHAEIARKGLERDLVVGSTLVDMYAKCGLPAKAQEAFDRLPVRNVVSWTALIGGYAEHGFGEEALNCFEQMQLEGFSPNAATFVCSLKACASVEAIDKGQEMHAKIARDGLDRDLFVGSTLVDMYAKCGSPTKAQEVFDQLPVRDTVLWNSLIVGYAEHCHGKKALNCLEQMQLEGLSPNGATFVCSLKACSSIGAIDKGREIHAEIVRKGLETDLVVGSTLVDMYAKCGSPARAQEVFNKLPVKNEVTWNALIAAYAYVGESENAFHMLDRMRDEGIKPDGVTFLNVLTVCSHTGLVDRGQNYYEAMSKDYGITPTAEHYTCMVDLLGRAGQLDEVVDMIKNMSFNPTLVLWHTVLGACQKWGNVELGRQVFEHAVHLDEKDAAAYVLMSNIYADAHMQEDEKNMEEMRMKQAWKKSGLNL